MGNLSEQTWDEYRNSEHAQEIFKNGADYVDEGTWQAWRRFKKDRNATLTVDGQEPK